MGSVRLSPLGGGAELGRQRMMANLGLEPPMPRVADYGGAASAWSSRSKAARLGESKRISGAGTRLWRMSGGTCLWCGKVELSEGSFGWGKSSYQQSRSSFR